MRPRTFLKTLAGAACAALLATAGSAAAADAPAAGTTTAAATTAAAPAPAVVDPVAGMAQAIATVSSYRMRMTMTLRASSEPQPITIDVTGETRTKPNFIRMDFDMSKMMIAAGAKAADGRYTMLISGTGPGTLMYVRGGPFGTAVRKGKTWGKVDVTRFARVSGVDLTKTTTAGNDPTAQVDALRKAGATYEIAGKEALGGVSTTHWRITAALAKVLRAQGSSAAQIKKTMAAMPAGTDTVTYDVWLDARSFPRRFLFTIPIISGTELAEMTMDMRMFSPGAIVRTALPPDRLVDDITQTMLDSLGG